MKSSFWKFYIFDFIAVLIILVIVLVLILMSVPIEEIIVIVIGIFSSYLVARFSFQNYSSIIAKTAIRRLITLYNTTYNLDRYLIDSSQTHTRARLLTVRYFNIIYRDCIKDSVSDWTDFYPEIDVVWDEKDTQE